MGADSRLRSGTAAEIGILPDGARLVWTLLYEEGRACTLFALGNRKGVCCRAVEPAGLWAEEWDGEEEA